MKSSQRRSLGNKNPGQLTLLLWQQQDHMAMLFWGQDWQSGAYLMYSPGRHP